MTTRPRGKANGPARPIRSKRDYDGASIAAGQLSAQASLDTAAELRLQSLIRELDRYEEASDEAVADYGNSENDYAGPRRRWSDDG